MEILPFIDKTIFLSLSLGLGLALDTYWKTTIWKSLINSEMNERKNNPSIMIVCNQVGQEDEEEENEDKVYSVTSGD